MKKLKQIRLSKIDKIAQISSIDDDVLDNCAKLIKSGIKLVIFNPENNDKINCAQGAKLVQLTSIYDVILTVKSRADIAKIIDSDGILLDKNSVSFNDVKKILNDEKFFGYSCSCEDDYNQIKSCEFDFIISNISNISTDKDIKHFNRIL